MDKLKPITLAGLAAITGIFGAVLILAISFLAGWPWFYSLVSLAGISAITWLLLMRRYLAIFTPANDVGLEPDEIYPTETTRIMVQGDHDSFTRGTWADFPISPDMLRQVALRLQNGGSFSHSSLAGPGKPLTRAQFENLRDLMIARSLAYWINPDAHAQGIALTRAGEAVIKYFCYGNDAVTLAPPQQSKMSTMVDKLPSNAPARERSSERKVIIDN